MAHRLFHTLVFSSVMALEGLGCAVSHRDPPPEPEPDPMDPFHPDAGWGHDAERPDTTPAADSGTAADSATSTDSATAADAATDTGPDPADLRLCEAGWPTTKASYCYTLDETEMPPTVICCGSVFTGDGGERCCLQEE